MPTLAHITRREFLRAKVGSVDPLHLSSAVVLAKPDTAEDVANRLALLDGVEVHAREAGKIVIVMEAASAGALGSRLAEISLMDGVISANMVFEHLDTSEETLK